MFLQKNVNLTAVGLAAGLVFAPTLQAAPRQHKPTAEETQIKEAADQEIIGQMINNLPELLTRAAFLKPLDPVRLKHPLKHGEDTLAIVVGDMKQDEISSVVAGKIFINLEICADYMAAAISAADPKSKKSQDYTLKVCQKFPTKVGMINPEHPLLTPEAPAQQEQPQIPNAALDL